MKKQKNTIQTIKLAVKKGKKNTSRRKNRKNLIMASACKWIRAMHNFKVWK